MPLYSKQNMRDASRLLYCSNLGIASEGRRQEPCLRKFLGHAYTYEQVSNWVYFHNQHMSYSRQETWSHVLEEPVHGEAVKNGPELCGVSTKPEPVSGPVVSEEEISNSDESDGYSDTSSEFSDSTISADEDGLDVESNGETDSLYYDAVECSVLNRQADTDVGLSSPKLSTEAKNQYVKGTDRVQAETLKAKTQRQVSWISSPA